MKEKKQKNETDPVLKEYETRYISTIKNPLVNKRPNTEISIKCIEIEEDYTKIDFKHSAGFEYIDGGWVRIHPQTYIRICSTGQKLQMFQAVNIPIKPLYHHYKHKLDTLEYSLYFPPIPKHIETIDIIEVLPDDGSSFNFFGVRIKESISSFLNVSYN